MSVKYVPVQWNRFKWLYDAAFLAGVVLFLWAFLTLSPDIRNHSNPIDAQIQNARAFGACSFLMMTIILCLGPLSRLDRRFLPLLYNRRHFGVMTAIVATTHASFVINWYFGLSHINKFEAVLVSNTNYTQISGFPFETFGIFALFCLLILAATSHDFWMKFLSPPLWKSLHFMIYPAYAAVVAHVALGALQNQESQVLTVFVIGCAGLVSGLHITAAIKERDYASAGTDWVHVCSIEEIADKHARIALLPNGDRVAIFRHGDRLSAIANACAHQNGPLGEGRIIRCLVTCPWHGFQYNVTNGRAPAPFTEKIPTYNLRLVDGAVFVDPNANPPGTYVEPVLAPIEQQAS
ncbi:Rieske 2Fe-2S domain-containing protein [Ruegeria atlantica]|uniref:Rieske 2Fe-2S domain-containing protein n=1 Tax=Ruegeria atlantica TaxID=81569 RepID=UPI00147A7EFB|nr:Rieske 2Fe-2S domain-containing protein [Ruegeria atlantica]